MKTIDLNWSIKDLDGNDLDSSIHHPNQDSGLDHVCPNHNYTDGFLQAVVLG